ncbi:hypothetical protein H072_2601 [Dactylellina haptotyla CBS 200.50]|uniref:DH domain-containing protein n=1 Tax=Dactylellina haptotyla (strain CBS 200.50) TaxID=1284197 RepID=S8AQM5_DACHA|nr:hypothetical protein H072_2601 [Dactylellina haptotyla CBS 200.50]
MARVSPQLPNLGRNHQIYVSPPDPLLTQVVIFFLPYSGTSSRVDAHIYTACGFVSYSRMTVDPSSAVYQAVNFMPIEKTESEVYRALAFALCRYFVELTVGVKGTTSATAKVAKTSKPEPFSAAHAGELAARLVRVDDDAAITSILAALRPRYIPSMDIDLVLPPQGTYRTSQYRRLLQFMGDVHKQDTNLKRRPSRVERTRPKSIPALPQSNPEKVAIKLQELLDTEVKYVEKLQRLLVDVVKPERQIAEQAEAPEPNETTLARLFPSYLDEICQLNANFLADLSKAMDDDDGVEAVVNTFLNHFPNFHTPYSKYIALNPASGGVLGELARSGSAFSQRMVGHGEQYLKSTLMEPIQRLPRYTLIIDGVLNNIAVTSAIAPKLVEAREIVSKTCEMQSAPAQERAQTITRLSSLISGWPANFKPGGPLVTAVDLTEVAAPYTDNADKFNVIILVFTDSIAFINRPSPASMKAQGVLTEITMPPSIQNSIRREAADLHFAGCTSLKYNRYSTSDDGSAMWITLTKDLEEVYDMRESAVGMKKFLPSGSWEGKANELVEEIIQAQLQSKSRVQEIRWSGDAHSKFDSLELWTSIYEPRDFELEKSPSRALIQLGVEHPTFDVRTKTPEISATMNFVSSGKIRIDILDMGKIAFTETVGELDILTVLTKRISSILDKHSQISHPPIIAAMIQAHRRIIKSLNLSIAEPDSHHSKFKTFRPPSPVKLLSTFLGSSTNSPGKLPFKATSFESTTEMARPTVMLERSHSVLYRADGSGPVEELASRMKDISLVENNVGDSYHKQLERVLDAFVSVLDGKLNKDAQPGWRYGRRSSNSHVVDQLVKGMLTDSGRTAAAQAANVNVVLNAFEKFLYGKWRDVMGTLLSQETVRDLQSKFDAYHPDDFVKYFRDSLDNLGPQNKRAFHKIAGLFSRAIQRASTDEAKSSLRTVFSEILISSGLNSSKISEVAKIHVELLLSMLNNVDTSPYTIPSKYNSYTMNYENMPPPPIPRRTMELYQDEWHEPMKANSRSQNSTPSPNKKKSKEKSSPSPTRGRSKFRIPMLPTMPSLSPTRRNDSSDSERSASPIRFDKPFEILKHSWENTMRFATYSPTKNAAYDSTSPFTSPTSDTSSLKRSKTTGTHALIGNSHTLPTVVPLTSSSSLRKRFGLSHASPDPSDSSPNTNGSSSSHKDGGGSLSKSSVKSMLRQRSNRGKDKDRDSVASTFGGLSTPSKVASLYRSQSTEADIRRDMYEKDMSPSRPMSRDGTSTIPRPASTIFMSNQSSPLGRSAMEIPKLSTSASASPLSPIVASPKVATLDAVAAASSVTENGSPLPSLRRRKRRSSLSDLVLVKDDDPEGEDKTEEIVETPPLENSLSRTGSIDRKENVSGNFSKGSMGPPPVPTHAKTASISSTREGRNSRTAAVDIYTDKIAPLNVSGVRTSRAYSDASTAPTNTRVSSRESTTPGNTTVEKSSKQTGKLSTRLAAEKTNVSKSSGTLEQELALIGQELLRGSKKGSDTSSILGGSSGFGRSGGRTSTGGAEPDDAMRRRLRHLESKLNNTVNDLNKRYETLRDDSHVALAKELQRNQEIERMWRDERNENDAVYNKFNDALEECVRGLKGKTDEDRAGLVRMLVQSQEEVAKLRAEVSSLKKENIELRHGKVTEL